MPFQNANSSFRNVVGDVILVTAGEDQTDICSPTVNLSATVLGDPTGHTFDWVQIEGPAVVIDDPNAISTFYTVAAPGLKVFRFYVDMGTASEQSDEVSIFDTPQSNYSGFSTLDGDGGAGFVRSLPPIFPVTNVNGSVANLVDPPAQLHGEAPVVQEFTVTWDHPGQINDDYIIQYELLEATVNVFQVNATPLTPTASGVDPVGPSGDPRSYNLGAITSYEVNTIYSFHGDQRESTSAVFDFTGTPVDPVIAIDDALDGGFSNRADEGSAISFVRFSNELINVPTDEFMGGFSQLDADEGTSVSFIRFSNELVDVPTDEFMGGFALLAGNNGTSASFTRFDPSGIGGGGG